MGRNAHKLPNKKWKLWTRGGTNDVSIINKKTEEEIKIPSGLLRELVAEDVRDERIRILEEAEDNEVLGLSDGPSV